MKRLLLLVLIALLLTPVLALAQDAEATPVVVPDAGNATIIFTPTPAPVDSAAVDNDTILIVGVLVVGFIGLGVVIARGGNPDAAATNQLQAWQLNRDFMAAQERAYQSTTAERRMFIDAVTNVTTAIAPLTNFLKSDDALARYLRDVQTPGPETPPTPPA